MNTLSATTHELITFLQQQRFEHLSQKEQVRLRDYLDQILITLHEAADLPRNRRYERAAKSRNSIKPHTLRGKKPVESSLAIANE